MRGLESLNEASDKVVVIIDAKSDIQQLGRIANELGSGVRALKLGVELFQFDRPWSIHRMLRDRGVDTWLDTRYMLDPDQASQAVKDTFNRGVKKVSVSPLSGVKSLISASSTVDDDKKIFVPLPNFHPHLVEPFLDDILEANESLPYRRQITDIMCNVGLIKTVKQMGNFSVIATGIRYDKRYQDDHPQVMTPKEAISEGADILAIGRLLTKYADVSYHTMLDQITGDISSA